MLAAGATQALRLFSRPLFALCKTQLTIVGGGKQQKPQEKIAPVQDKRRRQYINLNSNHYS